MISASIQPPGRDGSAQARTTSSKAVSTRTSYRRSERRNERLTRSAVEGQDAAGLGRPPPEPPAPPDAASGTARGGTRAGSCRERGRRRPRRCRRASAAVAGGNSHEVGGGSIGACGSGGPAVMGAAGCRARPRPRCRPPGSPCRFSAAPAAAPMRSGVNDTRFLPGAPDDPPAELLDDLVAGGSPEQAGRGAGELCGRAAVGHLQDADDVLGGTPRLSAHDVAIDGPLHPDARRERDPGRLVELGDQLHLDRDHHERLRGQLERQGAPGHRRRLATRPRARRWPRPPPRSRATRCGSACRPAATRRDRRGAPAGSRGRAPARGRPRRARPRRASGPTRPPWRPRRAPTG